MEILEELIGLQAIDTEVTQLLHRATHLPEAASVRTIEAELAALEADRNRAATEAGQLANTVEANERSVDELRKQIVRLNAQLRTVIAPREAEALQHEIAVLEGKISALDDEALVAIERSEELDAALATIGRSCDATSQRLNVARDELAVAQDAVRSALADARARRDDAAGRIDGGWLQQYDARRAAHAGTAVARLVRATCGGCHLDLSPSEVDAMRRLSPTERECPNCARWLVV